MCVYIYVCIYICYISILHAISCIYFHIHICLVIVHALYIYILCILYYIILYILYYIFYIICYILHYIILDYINTSGCLLDCFALTWLIYLEYIIYPGRNSCTHFGCDGPVYQRTEPLRMHWQEWDPRIYWKERSWSAPITRHPGSASTVDRRSRLRCLARLDCEILREAWPLSRGVVGQAEVSDSSHIYI